MYTGEIIDTHMHLWDLKNNYEWLSQRIPEFEALIGNYDSLRHNFLSTDYQKLVQDHKITQSVHLQAFGFPEDPVAETLWLQQQALQGGFPHAAVAFANLADPQVETILKRQAQCSIVRGIRMPLNYHDTAYRRMADRGDYMNDAQWRKGFALLAQYNFTLDVQVYDHQIDDVISLANTFPHINLIMEHLAWPTEFSNASFELWKQRIARLANLRNVSMKLSGIGCVFQHLETEKIIKYIVHAVNEFGVDRCMFGSNCPPDTLFYSFNDLIAFHKLALSAFSLDDQHKIFFANAKRIYRL